MINPDQAATAVMILSASFRLRLEQAEAEAMILRFTQPPFVDFDTLAATIGAAVDMLDRAPSMHQLIDAYQGEARHRVQAAQARDQLALERDGRGNPTMDDRYGREMVDVLRTALTEAMPAGDETRGHDHHRGAEHCPVCSRSDEIAATFEARVAELLKARHLVPAPQPVPLVRCRHCGDSGMITVDDNPATFSVKPCPECRTEAYEAWADGQLGLRRGVTR